MEYRRKEFEDYCSKVVDNLLKNHNGNIELLPQREQEVVRIWRLEMDMYNGGFMQFFHNWGHDNLEKIIGILLKIGAQTAFLIITECTYTVKEIQEQNKGNHIKDIADYFNPQQKKRMEELEELYWNNPDDLQLLCYNYYLYKQKKIGN